MRQILALAAALALAIPGAMIALPALTQAPESYSETERSALRDEIRAYLLENPEVLMEAIAILEQREQQEEEQAAARALSTNTDAIFNDGYSYVGGNPEGSVTLVEFLDYQCGYCKRAHASVMELITTDTDIRYVVKEFPILGPASLSASRAAKAALLNDGPDVYADFADALMRFEGQLNDTVIERIAAGAGVDVERMKASMNDQQITEMLGKNRSLAKELAISGTPTFIIGDQIVRGFLPLEDMRDVISKVREAL